MTKDKLTPDGRVMHWVFHPSRPYFFHDPEGDGFQYFATEEERDKAADEAIREYLADGCWAEEVVHVMAGKITHRSTEIDFVARPPDDELDEEGLDGEGNYWPDEFGDRCNYKLLSIDS